jgi:hypothetical protein
MNTPIDKARYVQVSMELIKVLDAEKTTQEERMLILQNLRDSCVLAHFSKAMGQMANQIKGKMNEDKSKAEEISSQKESEENKTESFAQIPEDNNC